MGSSANENGALLYTAITTSTATPPGYRPFYKLACVACAGYTSGKAPPTPPPPPPVVPAGEIFVRWGRLGCPDTAALLYTGVAAGAHYTVSGSGSNLICLTPNGQYAEGYYNNDDSTSGDLYRAEYETQGMVRVSKCYPITCLPYAM